jgi:hypothetical protein
MFTIYPVIIKKKGMNHLKAGSTGIQVVTFLDTGADKIIENVSI